MHTARPASLLVAALALLRQPCSRSRATARLLLERAAETGELTPAERDVCRSLADDMDVERPTPRPSAGAPGSRPRDAVGATLPALAPLKDQRATP